MIKQSRLFLCHQESVFPKNVASNFLEKIPFRLHLINSEESDKNKKVEVNIGIEKIK